jgi:hypothetical protein
MRGRYSADRAGSAADIAVDMMDNASALHHIPTATTTREDSLSKMAQITHTTSRRGLKQSTELLDDPGRCIHIGDRESDIYELFCTSQEVGTHFLVRTCVDRLAGDGDHTVADEMDATSIKGLHRIEVRDDKGDLEEAILEIRYRRIRILPPIGKQKRYPALTLTVIHAQEQKTPKNRKKIDWKLLTDLPV